MKIINNLDELLSLVAARKLRAQGFEVYHLPITSSRELPDLVAYRYGRFYNVYLFKSQEEKIKLFSGDTRLGAFAYAKPLAAVVATLTVKIVVAK